MANPRLVLKIALGPQEKEDKANAAEEAAESPITELIERVFTTRNLVHFSHWGTSSFAAHSALGDLYDDIVDLVDNLVETYQGEFGLIKDLETCEAKLDRDIILIIEDDSNWIKANRTGISQGSTTIENLIDGLMGAYNKTLYKLKNLK